MAGSGNARSINTSEIADLTTKRMKPFKCASTVGDDTVRILSVTDEPDNQDDDSHGEEDNTNTGGSRDWAGGQDAKWKLW